MKKENKKKTLTEEKFKSLLMAIILTISSFNLGYYLNKKNDTNKVNNIINSNIHSAFDTEDEDIEKENDEEYDEYTEYSIGNLYLIDVSMCKSLEAYDGKVFTIAYKKLDSYDCDIHNKDDFTYVYREWQTFYDISKDFDIYFINELYSLNGKGNDLIPGNTSIDSNNRKIIFRNYDYKNIVSLDLVVAYLDDKTLNSYISEDGYIKREDIKEVNKLLDVILNNNKSKNCSTLINNNITKKLYRA